MDKAEVFFYVVLLLLFLTLNSLSLMGVING
jgi:hypothetical protein